VARGLKVHGGNTTITRIERENVGGDYGVREGIWRERERRGSGD
jgi:putative component of toxin-antitoxin plasmid stabilization module